MLEIKSLTDREIFERCPQFKKKLRGEFRTEAVSRVP
jgi:hypothetical protein